MPHPRVIDITGQQFGRLVALEQAASRPGGEARWRCQCQCGNESIATSSNLRRGLITSCGCLQQERARDTSARHGYCGTPEYNTWRGIQRRCNNPKARSYDMHGGRGIKCLWTDYEQFVADVGLRPSPNHRLYRLDRDQHFEPDNCRWLLPAEHYQLCTGAYTENLRHRRR